ncbi:PH domain-containing protein [Niveispirillum sp. BGYR6]|uniref:PH domain-containing protein n=1 Tax=Niveispirillum sp. BGYR6 TaxID=2971249 RepID=UPI0022B98864|nr:PH domain-containing protein [Niveispirillum sp. BGYR6]MDG5494781.1 PH domain-containing protein [Niveispirillum sp. BGYR6]
MAEQAVEVREQDVPLLVAQFDPKLRLYLFLQASFLLCVTVVGLVLLPLTLAAAWWWARHYYPTIRCHVTSRRLYFQHGILFQRESAVPLDKIQDMSLLRGPVLNMLGLTRLTLETAGGSSEAGALGGGVKLLGLRDARTFQEKVLRLRDAACRGETVPDVAPSAPADSLQVLLEIRDSLHRIEQKLGPTA